MDELLLIEMMSELDPKYINNNYIEKDMNHGKFVSLFKRKTKTYDFSSFNTDRKMDVNSVAHKENLSPKKEKYVLEKNNIIYFPNEEMVDELINNSLSNIGIYKKKKSVIYTIISAIVAAILIASGIVMLIIKHGKRSGFVRVFKTT